MKFRNSIWRNDNLNIYSFLKYTKQAKDRRSKSQSTIRYRYSSKFFISIASIVHVPAFTPFFLRAVNQHLTRREIDFSTINNMYENNLSINNNIRGDAK